MDSSKTGKGQHDLEAPTPMDATVSQVGEISKEQEVDAVFGAVTDHGPNYRALGWIGTVALMLKTQIGLGVLSLPHAFHTLGMIPGAIILCAVAGIAIWTSYIVGVFKLNHRDVYGIDDAGYLMFGRVGRELFAIAFCLYWIFVAGSGMLGISIGLNAISVHGTCTAVFVVVAAISGFLLASIRTLGRISWLAWVGLAFILCSVFVVTISVGIQDRPAEAPQTGPWESDWQLIGHPTFSQGVAAVSTLIFACSATSAYFAIVCEMRDPRDFSRSVITAQVISTIVYLIVAVVVYYFCGSAVASPALGSAGPLIKKIAYGLALPGLLVTTTICLHLPAKYFLVRILRGSEHLTANSLVHWCTWLGCTGGSTLIAYVIASGIPVFGDLVSLIGALLGFCLAYQPTGCMWLYDNWGRQNRDWKWNGMVAWCVFIIALGSFMTVSGTYGSIVNIIDSLKKSGGTRPWTCADNSNSV
ncbi:hypothetical protein LCI18_002673 [Fusarium solani-melongenae]|uniref:Uncharacterized protein n=1 Tax=Fusarium solani subsp. cucurbitae TaxID=2747967 RepID=A0ACD3YSA4_FUSSC|nr:hypothetical protein LCI18_002673 [Fusarium solani-melongenae]